MPILYLVMVASALLGKTLESQGLASDYPHRPSSGLIALGLLLLLSAALSRLMMAHSAALLDLRQITAGLRLARRYRMIMQWSLTVVGPIVLAASGWNVALSAIPGMESSLTLQLVGWLLPSWLFLTVIDFAWFEWESYAKELASRLNAVRSHKVESSNGASTFAHFWWNHARHGWLLISMAAILVCATIDAIGLAFPHLESPLARLTVYVGTTLLGVALLPEWIYWMWSNTPLGKDEVEMEMADLWKQVSGRQSRSMLWHTGMSQCNAMVVGVIPWRRRLLLSDLLLAKLPSNELKMVICHEAAHIQRWHAWIRMLPLFLGLLVVAASQMIYAGYGDGYGDGGMMLDHRAMWPFLAAKVGLGLWLFCRIAHWTELDADRQAVLIATQIGLFEKSAEGRQQAAMTLSKALQAITPPAMLHRQTWLYPSVRKRCSILELA